MLPRFIYKYYFFALIDASKLLCVVDLMLSLFLSLTH